MLTLRAFGLYCLSRAGIVTTKGTTVSTQFFGCGCKDECQHFSLIINVSLEIQWAGEQSQNKSVLIHIYIDCTALYIS